MHANPTGSARRATLLGLSGAGSQAPRVAGERRPGSAPDVTITDLTADYAGALASASDPPVDVLGVSTGGSVAL